MNCPFLKRARAELDPGSFYASGFPGMNLVKLSEKGYEQRSKRGFGRYTEGKLGQIRTFRRPVELNCKHLRDFSGSFSKQLSWKLVKVADT